MALKKASLACTVCGSRNYSLNLSSNPKPTRLEVNKFCKHCGQYTVHKETRQELHMKFVSNIFSILKETAWPTGKQSWKDFASVIQYSAFFVALIYLFDLILSKGIMSLINLFQKMLAIFKMEVV